MTAGGQQSSAELDLLYTDVEEALRASVRALIDRTCTREDITGLYDGAPGKSAELWHGLAVDLGLAGLLIPEEFGGAGASAREAAVVLEELGRAVAPVPYLTSAVVAATALVSAGAASLAADIAGGRIAALAVPFTMTADRARPSVTVGAEGTLVGEIRSVAGATDADLILVPVSAAGEPQLHVVAAGDVQINPVVSLDMTRPVADIDMSGARGEVLARGEGAHTAVRAALDIGAALLASEQLGLAQWCLETTVEYLKVRRQFGRIVGGFQSLKHRLADLYVQVESAHAAARYAAATVAAGDDDRVVAASLAQAYCSDVAVLAAEECIQLHGGIGMTWEHPAHLYLKRAKADQLGFGTPGIHHTRLAALLQLN